MPGPWQIYSNLVDIMPASSMLRIRCAAPDGRPTTSSTMECDAIGHADRKDA
jgi:hypothetical protein